MGISSFELKPHWSESFQRSTGPNFVEKVQDIVGLYVSRPTTRSSFAWTRSRKTIKLHGEK